MTPLRIAVDARPLALPMVGITRYSYELLKRLTANSPHQWFLYLDRPYVHALDDLPNVHIREGCCRANFFSSIFAQLVFPRWAKEDDIDIFWSPRHHLPLLLTSNIKQVVTVHDLVWQFYPETMSRLGRYLEQVLMPLSVKRADKVVSVSQSTTKALQTVLSVPMDKLITIPLASHLSAEHAAKDEERSKDYFLFVGTLEPRKNLQRLLKAFSQALQCGLPVTELKIVGGKGWGGVDIKDLVAEYNIEHNVTVLGRVDNDQLTELYANAYVLLMPSIYEGFGLPLLESMIFGVPVVSSNVSSMPEVVGEGGLLVDPCSVDAIACAMREITSDKDMYDLLSVNAKQQALQFSWDRAARETLTVIEQVA
jgi:glycosyltransferase involved in cell wall biosynthesis